MIGLYTSYRDLCIEIEWLECEIDRLKGEQEDWWIGGWLFELVPMDNAAERVDRISKRINKLQDLLDIKKRFQRQTAAYIDSLEGIEHRIAYKKYVENKLLKEIADDLSVSYDHVRRIHSRMKNADATFVPHTDCIS